MREFELVSIDFLPVTFLAVSKICNRSNSKNSSTVGGVRKLLKPGLQTICDDGAFKTLPCTKTKKALLFKIANILCVIPHIDFIYIIQDVP